MRIKLWNTLKLTGDTHLKVLNITWPTGLLAAVLTLGAVATSAAGEAVAKTERPKKGEPAVKAAAQKQTGASGFDIPIPVGQTSSGVVVQNINDRGDDLGVMKANEATRINESEVELGDLRMKIRGTEKQPEETNISIDKAVL